MVGDSWCLSVESGHVEESQWREGPGNMKAAPEPAALGKQGLKPKAGGDQTL